MIKFLKIGCVILVLIYALAWITGGFWAMYVPSSLDNSTKEKLLIKRWSKENINVKIEQYEYEKLEVSPYKFIGIVISESKYNYLKSSGLIERTVDSLKSDLNINLNPDFKFDTLIISISIKIPKEKDKTHSPEFDTTNDYLEVFQKKYKGNTKQ